MEEVTETFRPTEQPPIGVILKHAHTNITRSSPPSSPRSSALITPSLFTSTTDHIDLPPDLPPPPPPQQQPPEPTKPLPKATSAVMRAIHHAEPGKSVSSDSGIDKDHATAAAKNLPRTQSTKVCV
jgi:hypothetical protein